MSFRTGLHASFRPFAFRTAGHHFTQFAPTSRRSLNTLPFPQVSKSARLNLSPLLFPLALGGSYLTYKSASSPAQCESATGSLAAAFGSNPKPEVGGGQPPAQSDLSAYQLGFGAVCGICTGVFVKKGLKAIAFLLGGVFVLMQYMSSKRFISVDWSKLSGSYDKTFGTKTPTGEVRAPSVGGVWAWFVDFVTANFQQRATFLAGLALGLRLG